MAKLAEKIKRDPRVKELYSEFGNIDAHKLDWWVHLANGWILKPDGTHGIHEQTLTAVAARLREVVRCSCRECEWDGKPREEAP